MSSNLVKYVINKGGRLREAALFLLAAMVIISMMPGLAKPDNSKSLLEKNESNASQEYSAYSVPLNKTQADNIALDMCSLPSSQGWTYVSPWNTRSEADAFSIRDSGQGCYLYQNTIGIPFQNQDSNAYIRYDVVDPTKPFEIKIRAKILQEQMASGSGYVNHYGFCFGAGTGTEDIGIGLGTDTITATESENANKILATGQDNGIFHDYRLNVSPATGYSLYVDGDLLASGSPRIGEGQNRIYFGDGTGGCNAEAEIESFEFQQETSEPQPLPDLAIFESDITFSNSDPLIGDIITIIATVHNIGDIDVENDPFFVSFYEGDSEKGKLIGSVSFSDIEAGGTAIAAIDYKVGTQKPAIIFVSVDSENYVKELSKGNNKASQIINSISPDQYVEFSSPELLPISTDEGLLANGDAYVSLIVKNTGKEKIPPTFWNLDLTFLDVPGKGADGIGAFIDKEEHWILKRHMILKIPEIESGMTIPVSCEKFSLAPDITAGDSYAPFADKLQMEFRCGDSYINKYIDNLNIRTNTLGDEGNCLWSFTKILLTVYGGAIAASLGPVAEVPPEYIDAANCIMKATGNVLVYYASDDAHKKGSDLILQLTLCSGEVQALGFKTWFNVFKAIGAFFTFTGYISNCSNFLADLIYETTSCANAVGELYASSMWNANADVQITTPDGKVTHVYNEVELNEIPQAQVIFDENFNKLIFIPGLIEADLQLTWRYLETNSQSLILKENSISNLGSARSENLEMLSITPIGQNESIYQHFKVPVINGSVLRSKYKNTTGWGVMSVDYNGDGIVDHNSYPDLLKFRNQTFGISTKQSVYPAHASPGSIIRYTIEIANIGNTTLSHVKLIDILPLGLDYVSDDNSGIISGNTISWDDLGSLDEGKSKHIKLIAIVNKHANGEIINRVESLAILPDLGNICSFSERSLNITLPAIEVKKIFGLNEPIQYEQFCNSGNLDGKGAIDIQNTFKDYRIALNYNNDMVGEGDIELESEVALSEKASRLQRSLGNNTTSLNLYEDTKLTYSGETPLSGGKYLESRELFGGIGTRIQEAFSVNEMEKDQQTFFASTDPASNEVDQNKSDPLRNASCTHLVALETKNTFNGTWGTDATWHKIFYQDVNAHEMFTGTFEAEKLIKFHENPVPGEEHNACRGIDC